MGLTHYSYLLSYSLFLCFKVRSPKVFQEQGIPFAVIRLIYPFTFTFYKSLLFSCIYIAKRGLNKLKKTISDPQNVDKSKKTSTDWILTF